MNAIEDIKDCWHGRRPLGKIFCVYYIGGTLVLLVIFGSILGILLHVFPDDPSHAPMAVGAIIYSSFAFILVYQVWAMVSVWRSASNDSSVWGALAHIWIGIVILGFLIRVVAAVYPGYGQIFRDTAAKRQTPSQH